MRLSNTTKDIKDVSKELIKAETILHCVAPQLEMLHEYLQGVGMKSPAAVIYADIVMDILDKVSDVQTMIINNR